ncbi:LRR receptor-like serine threonine-protein kinase [Seminavis robusta]|uniref:LRR receptor-like serine threonine-protein kinase n=1 Tax=Seminavis robusta TaxID=568900 RepID=A0A9N8HJF1_9STRA|nr:LRR receptor-like serine threonine-protein kinase [Seminavis robusta]|eukprot:Sro658_g182660.1 LRR receptor-like serine threonine-protein kinase (830) ;mRNA; f:7242-9979
MADRDNFTEEDLRRGSGTEFLGAVGQALMNSDGHVSLVDETSDHVDADEINLAASSNMRSNNSRSPRSAGRTQSSRSRSPTRKGGVPKANSGTTTWRRNVSRPNFERTAVAPTRKTPGRNMSGSGRHHGTNRHSSFVRHYSDDDDDKDNDLLDSDDDLLEDDDFDVSAREDSSQSDKSLNTIKEQASIRGSSTSKASTSGGRGGGRDSDRKSLWKSREGVVDQSVNLMDAETGQYQHKKKKGGSKRGAGLGFRQKSLVDIFLHDDTERSSKVWGIDSFNGDPNKDYYDDDRSRATRWIICIVLFLMVLTAFIIVPDFGLIDLVSSDSDEQESTPVTPAPTSLAPTPSPVAPEAPEEEEEEETAPTEAEAANLEPPEEPEAEEQPLVVNTEQEEGGTSLLDVIRPNEEPIAVIAPETPPPEATTSPFPPRSSNEQQLEFLVIDQDVSNPEDFQDPESPQSKALSWIVSQDPAKLPVPGAEGVKVDNVQQAKRQLMQRYALAVFYFAMETGVEGGNQQQGQRLLRQQQRDASSSRHLESNEQRDNRRQFDMEWTRGASVCEWPGIQCNNQQEVTTLDASNCLLAGSLPREIFRGTAMPALTTLDLSYNELQGILPSFAPNISMGRSFSDEMGNKLEKLYLQHNSIEGTIEPLLDLPHLTYADLSTNGFTGTIAKAFGTRLTELDTFHLAMNNVGGTLPSELASMTRLARLDLEGNQFTGSIPPSWSRLSKLEVLTLSHCDELEGTIPSALANMPSMKYLSLQKTNLEGPIPSFLGGLTHLKELYLHNTKLTGQMPRELCSLRDANSLEALTSDCSDIGGVACDCCTDCFFR